MYAGSLRIIQVLAGHSRNTTYTKQLIDIKDGKIPIPKQMVDIKVKGDILKLKGAPQKETYA